MSKHFTPKIFAPLTQHIEIFPLLFSGCGTPKIFHRMPSWQIHFSLSNTVTVCFYDCDFSHLEPAGPNNHPPHCIQQLFFLNTFFASYFFPFKLAFFHFYFSGTHTILDFGACTAHSLYHYSSAAHFERNCAHGFRPMLHASIRSLSTADWLTLFF